jgi:hypothetical protein
MMADGNDGFPHTVHYDLGPEIQKLSAVFVGTLVFWLASAYLTSSSVDSIASWSNRSTFRTGGTALESPVPTAFQPVLSNACRTFRPSRPEAPVTKAVLPIFQLSFWNGSPTGCENDIEI